MLNAVRGPRKATAARLGCALEAKDSTHRAVLRMPATEADLAAACTAPVAFQDSDGVELSDGNTCVTNSFVATTRQAVLSENWVHALHDVKHLTWSLRIKQAHFEYGDLFFGLTEATSFHLQGRSISFDVRGNFNIGWSPQNLSHRFRAESLENVDGATVSGTLDGPSLCDIKVTADLEKSLMTVSLPNGMITYPMHEWASARLFVSFSSFMDTVCLC